MIVVSSGVDGARLRNRIFRPQYTPMADHISTSDPANNPLSVDSFLEGGESPIVQSWSSAIEEQPLARELEQEVLIPSQRQEQQEQYASAAGPTSMLEQGQRWAEEGHHASDYEPGDWPKQAITPDPYAHLAQIQGGGTNEHNNIGGALGVQSASIPWDYRHYSGNLNSHRKAEPLIYTPLVLAKDHDGQSAIDLTSLVNRKYQSQRMSSNPQYANTLSALTDYKPIQLNPTDHWLPQMPVRGAPGVKNPKYWEKHFLDLYAPTPPPLLAPVPPRMKSNKQAKQTSFVETQAVELPAILRRGERVKPLITPVFDSNNQPIAFHDQQAEDEQVMHEREVDIFAPAHTSFLETEVDVDELDMDELESMEDAEFDDGEF
jgi:hypothetical protein